MRRILMIKMYQNLHRRLFSEENMFLFYFQPDSTRAERAWTSLRLAGVFFEQAAAIFGQLLPSQSKTDIHCKTQHEYQDGLPSKNTTATLK